MNRNQLAGTIKELAVLRGDFLLRSGARAAVYFDKYQFESQPTVLFAIADHLAPLVPSGVDALAGLELGGVPIATALSLQTGIPAIFVRKRAKEYGTARLAEGGEIAGRRLLIIEDVVTSGGQVVASCAALRALGAEVTHALCVVDRDQGGHGALAAVGVTLTPLFKHGEILNATG